MTTRGDIPGECIVVEQARFCRVHLSLPPVVGERWAESHAWLGSMVGVLPRPASATPPKQSPDAMIVCPLRSARRTA